MEFSDEERQIVEDVGAEHVDYALCALFNHRNQESVVLDEQKDIISVEGMEVKLKSPESMLEKYTETDDPMEAIRAGVALLECSVSFMHQLSD